MIFLNMVYLTVASPTDHMMDLAVNTTDKRLKTAVGATVKVETVLKTLEVIIITKETGVWIGQVSSRDGNKLQ
jgi:hypothetical protein